MGEEYNPSYHIEAPTLHTIILKDLDAIIEMLGEESDPSSAHSLPPDKFYNPGSDISLKCIIRRHLIMNATVQDITNVSWKKNGVMIDLQTQERIRQAENCPSPVLP